MNTVPLVQDLFDHYDWARERLLGLAAGLTDDQLDAPAPLGWGSLRATLVHLLTAERLWLDRWRDRPWAPLANADQPLSLDELAERLRALADERNQWLDSTPDLAQIVHYQNSQRQAFSHPLRELLIHVICHGLHHRAQALQFLRRCGRTITGGLDYLFFKLSHPTLPQESDTVEKLASRGLMIGAATDVHVTIDREMLRRWFAYGDWAMGQVMGYAAACSPDELDRPFEMGMGTLRGTLTHIRDAEHWWWNNWTTGPSAFDRLPATTAIDQLRDLWADTARRRDAFIAEGDESRFLATVVAAMGGLRLAMPLGQSMVQLCGHGTHHRAQAINMLRQLGQTTENIDYVIWIRKVGWN